MTYSRTHTHIFMTSIILMRISTELDFELFCFRTGTDVEKSVRIFRCMIHKINRLF